MTNAIKDQNHIPVWLGVSCVDGTTLVPIKVDASSGGIKTDYTSTFSGTIDTSATRDGNHLPVMMGVNSDDGTLIPVYVNPTTGAILVDIL